MHGGDGNDTYIVDDAGDTISEAGGTDVILTTLSFYSLSNTLNVENLTYAGSGSFQGYGSEAANVMVGGGANDTLWGDIGDDTLRGEAGNDSLDGADGNDSLDGGAEIDTLRGGAGDDLFIVDNMGDLIVETAGGGNDTIRTSLSEFSLADLPEVENFVFAGTTGVALSGNAAANRLSGGTKADTLDGGAGADTLSGLDGDDLYIVDNAGDVVIESNGTDTVRTSLSNYIMPTGIDRLVYVGMGSIAVTGNELNNTISGGTGNDVLNGGSGRNSMVGGKGNDLYVVEGSSWDAIVELENGGIDTINSSR